MSNEKLLAEAVINLTRLVHAMDERIKALEGNRQRGNENEIAYEAADLAYKRNRDLFERLKR